MLTILDCARISGHIYHPTMGSYQGLKVKLLKEKSPVPEGWAIPIVDPKMDPDAHFYAALYINFKNGQAQDAVLAARGTSNIYEGIDDIISWFSDATGEGTHASMPSHFHTFSRFMHKARDYLANHYGISHMTYTGHSYGGAIAQLLALSTIHNRTVIFNSPGCAHIEGINKHYAPLVTNINSRYGVINKIGPIVPGEHLHWIDVPDDEVAAKAIIDGVNMQELKESFELDHASDQIPSNTSLDNFMSAAADTAAFVTRAVAVAHTASPLSKAPSVQPLFVQCEHEHPYLKGLRDICDAGAMKDAYKNTIIAQHGILNVTKTLMSEQYQSLAHHPVVNVSSCIKMAA